MTGIFPKQTWDEVDPQKRGWQTDLLSRARNAARAFGTISGFVVHRGALIASHGDLTQKILIRSIRKSFLSALIGIELERGRIRLDDTMADLGIDDVHGLTAAERHATVRQLLQARSGIYHPALAESKEMLAAKPPRGSSQPGERWYYNNWDFNALGTI
jgi:CubicO group peptidase (beta-lactamase class C family)